MDIMERARRYMTKQPVSVEGSNGSAKLKSAAMVLHYGFNLGESDCLSLLREWNMGCMPPWGEKDMERIVRRTPDFTSDKPRGYLLNSSQTHTVERRNPGVAEAPRVRAEGVPKFEPETLSRMIHNVAPVTRDFFRKNSPMPVEGVSPGQFLDAIFDKGQRILICTEFKSQGDFLWEVGRGGFRLGAREGIKAVPSALPTDGGKDGVWYLLQPVGGTWKQNPMERTKKTRRSGVNVTQWRHVLIESDCASEEEWLRLCMVLPIPIVAMYSSGGKSIHVLVRVDIDTYEELSALLKNTFKKILAPLGGDPGAMTAVRLTRLPGCLRSGRMQELIYLNPNVLNEPYERIIDRPRKA